MNENNQEITAELFDRILNLKKGKQGVIIIFSEGTGKNNKVDMFSLGIEDRSVPYVLYETILQYRKSKYIDKERGSNDRPGS